MSKTATKSVANAGDRLASPATMAIFGAAGDLTKRLVVPALYNLARAGRLPSKFSIIGVDHTGLTTDTWRQSLTDEMRSLMQTGGGESQAERIDKQAWDWLVSRMQYLRGDFTDSGTYRELNALTARQNGGAGGNILFYLATADRFFSEIIKQLGQAGLTVQSDGVWRRVIIEKPFGHDFPSAEALNEGNLKILSEDQI
jgi:glucose-6-phosphate 1-dehydrogenase